jgi:hypothetical protein
MLPKQLNTLKSLKSAFISVLFTDARGDLVDYGVPLHNVQLWPMSCYKQTLIHALQNI